MVSGVFDSIFHVNVSLFRSTRKHWEDFEESTIGLLCRFSRSPSPAAASPSFCAPAASSSSLLRCSALLFPARLAYGFGALCLRIAFFLGLTGFLGRLPVSTRTLGQEPGTFSRSPKSSSPPSLCPCPSTAAPGPPPRRRRTRGRRGRGKRRPARELQEVGRQKRNLFCQETPCAVRHHSHVDEPDGRVHGGTKGGRGECRDWSQTVETLLWRRKSVFTG